ncbi:unnamed protein product [Symbiodinium sp. CCMP2592]|nr:unnamed protein product [Symbiodinium sp. CCMP2592]
MVTMVGGDADDDDGDASYVAMCSHVIAPPSWKYLGSAADDGDVVCTCGQLRTRAEEVGDEEQILDLICEANELRDALRNYETFDALWEPAWNFEYDEVVSSPLLRSCWVLTGLLPCAACRKLFFAAGSRGFEEDSGDASRFGSRLQNFGRVLRSDDEPLAELLWKRAPSLHLRPFHSCPRPRAGAP